MVSRDTIRMSQEEGRWFSEENDRYVSRPA